MNNRPYKQVMLTEERNIYPVRNGLQDSTWRKRNNFETLANIEYTKTKSVGSGYLKN